MKENVWLLNVIDELHMNKLTLQEKIRLVFQNNEPFTGRISTGASKSWRVLKMKEIAIDDLSRQDSEARASQLHRKAKEIH